jgi:predicted NACHT family NTPase
MIINPEQVISAITGIANPLIKEKIQRNETVIKLLQQFKLDPEHPPADFSGVYAYTLVEYGVGKPKPCLELFRQEEIKLAFRKAFDHNNPSILLSEVDACIDACDFGDEIKALRIDVRREIAAFYIVFSEVAKRSRNPADTLMSQQIGSVHKQITSIQEQLDRLPTLEGIRTEIARLAAQNYPALPGAEAAAENRCRAIALAQQMRGWFETLDYQLEKYEVWAEDYFEFIINIPVRRSFDRILVRGVAGEIGLSDVMALHSSVESQKTDEGWLVTTRRISQAARSEVKKEENRHLDCYTFDELIDLDADFSGYVDWLEAEIKRRKIDTKYVPLACIKEEIDPVTKQRIGVSRYAEEDNWIDGYIDLWLDDPVKEHVSILGEFGTGKTWFAFHYASLALQRYRDAQRRGVERSRLPLVITLRDFAKALNVENVLAGFFFTQHDIRINSSVFEQLNRMGKLLLIFDGFDEMAAKVDRQQMINNFWELAKVVVPGAKVILTCRTEHFPEAQEGRALLNAELQASTKLLTGETPQFEVLELEKFDDDQIRQVLSHQATASTVEQVMSNPQLLDLARRPVMTELILEALPDIEAGKPVDMSRVYLYAVRRKMERDIRAARTFTSFAEKLYFLCELSWEMLSTDQMSLNYRLFPDRIRRLFGGIVLTQKDLDHWHFDMMGQTMLIRNSDGDYTPAHRSLLEFFVAYKFAAELGVLADDFIELARSQSCLNTNATPVDYTWSQYFSRQLDKSGVSVAIAPLKGFVCEALEKLRETFGLKTLTKAVVDLLVPMLDIQAIDKIIKIIQVTKGKSEDEVVYTGGNAVNLAVKLDKTVLEGRDLSTVVVKGADFSNVSLRNINFAGSNLNKNIWTKMLGRVQSVAFSSNGKVLATGDNDGAVRLWDIRTGKEILTCKEHRSWVYSVAFSPDSKILASASYDQTVKLWDANSGLCFKTLQGHTDWIISVAFHPQGNFVATGSYDRTIKLWDVSTGTCLQSFGGHSHRVTSVTFHPQGNLIATGSFDQTVSLWDTYTGECLKTFYGHISKVCSVAFCPQGNLIASASADSTVKLWDVDTGECLTTISHGHSNEVRSIQFHPKGNVIICGRSDGRISIWNIKTGQCLNNFHQHFSNILSLAVSPQGNLIASASADSTVKLWDIDTGECFITLLGHTNRLCSVTFSPNNRLIASGGDDHMVRLWDVNTAACSKIFQGHDDWVNAVAYSPSGKLIASASDDKTVKIWDISAGKCIKTLHGHFTGINSIKFSPCGNLLATGSFDKTIRLWDYCTGDCLNILQEHLNAVWSVAFSLDGKYLASSSSDKTVKLWDIYTGSCTKTLQGHSNRVFSVVFNPQGNLLASSSHDKTIRLWDINTGICVQVLHGHTSPTLSVAFHPQGNLLVSGGDDLTVRLWDISTGKCIKILEGHTGSIESVAFSSDGNTIVSCDADGNIKLWDTNTCQCLNSLSDRPYENMNITGVKGLTDAEIATLKALGAVSDEEL